MSRAEELVGCCKAVAHCKTMGKASQMSVFVEIMKMIARTGMDKAHASTVKDMVPFFDSALFQQYTRLQGHGISATSWL